jgi:hypothetical protein
MCALFAIRQHVSSIAILPDGPARSVLLVEGTHEEAILQTVIEVAPYCNNTVDYPVYVDTAFVSELRVEDIQLTPTIAAAIDQI